MEQYSQGELFPLPGKDAADTVAVLPPSSVRAPQEERVSRAWADLGGGIGNKPTTTGGELVTGYAEFLAARAALRSRK